METQTTKHKELESIHEYIGWCYDTNFRGFTDKVRQNNKSSLKSKTKINEEATRLQELIKNETNPALKKMFKQNLTAFDNTEEVLRKRWGNTLNLIGKSQAQITKEKKAKEQAKEKIEA